MKLFKPPIINSKADKILTILCCHCMGVGIGIFWVDGNYFASLWAAISLTWFAIAWGWRALSKDMMETIKSQQESMDGLFQHYTNLHESTLHKDIQIRELGKKLEDELFKDVKDSVMQ